MVARVLRGAGVGLLLSGLGAWSTAQEPAAEPPKIRLRPVLAAPSPSVPLSLQPLPAAPTPNDGPKTVLSELADEAVGIRLSEALRLAQLVNLDIAQAQQVILQARAARERARVLWLPTLGAGAVYVDHEGRIQQANGNILNVNRNSLFVGGLGPTVSFSLSDALLQPAVANRLLRAAQAGAGRVTYDTLLAVGDAYFAVLRARRRIARVDETLDYLTSPRKLPLRSDLQGLLPVLQAFAKEGAASDAEIARAQVEVVRRRDEGTAVLQEMQLATAELARLLRLDPQLLLWPLDGGENLPGDDWLACPVEELVAYALRNRPEAAESRALVDAAVARLQAARWRPLVPNFSIASQAGGFGGSPIIKGRVGTRDVFGRDGRIDRFGHRHDFEFALFWRLQNLGFGNDADRREQRALRDQTRLREIQVQDRIMAQVVAAHEQVLRSQERVRILREGLYDDRGALAGPVYRSLRLNFARLRGGLSRPLEVLDAIRGLNDTQEAYLNALSDYERARFRFLLVLGVPLEALFDPSRMPAPPCPCSGSAPSAARVGYRELPPPMPRAEEQP